MRDGGYQECGNLLEFSKRFQDEDASRQHLFNRRWPNGFACPRCGGVEYYLISTRHLYECRYCRHQSSLTAGTVMEKTRTPLRVWFFLIFLMANQKTGMSVLGAARVLGIPYDRAWRICHKIRGAMEERDASYKLAGFVEMDESYFGAKKSSKRGRGAEGKRPVMVGVSLNDGRPAHAFMKVVETVDGDTIENTASERIESGSGVKTDGLPAYNAGLTAWIPSRASHHQGPEDRLKEAPLGAHTRRQREEHDKGLSGTVDWILRHARRLTLSYPSRPRGLPVVVRQLSRMWIYHSSCLHLSQTQGLREGTGLALVEDGDRKKDGPVMRVSPDDGKTRGLEVTWRGQLARTRRTAVNRAGKAQFEVECWRWRRHMGNTRGNVGFVRRLSWQR